jgi:hypothetical protein
VLEQELGSSIEQLAAAAAAVDEREAQIQVDSERLLEALDAIRALAAELVSGSEEISDEPETVEAESEATVVSDTVENDTVENDAVESEAPEPAHEPDVEAEEMEYSLFVPGPNGYELVPQTGVPPQAGQTVELIFPDREEPAVFEVVRSGRPLPGGDVCVYLAQV